MRKLINLNAHLLVVASMQHVFVSGQTDEESKQVLRDLIARLQGATSKQEKQVCVSALAPLSLFRLDSYSRACGGTWTWRKQKQIDGELDKLLRDISPSGASGGNARASGSLGSKAGAQVAATLLSEKSGAKLGILPAQKMVPSDLEQSRQEKRTVKIGPPEEVIRSTSSPNSPSSSSSATSLSSYERKAKEEAGGKSEEHRIKLSRRRSAPPAKKGARFRRSGDQLFGLCDECSLSTEVCMPDLCV
jgi:hypothetical protein